EQLSIQKMNIAIEKLERKYDVEVKEFVVATILRNDEFIMKWFIGCNKDLDDKEAADFIDAELCDNNKNYKVARGKALKGMEVEVIPIELFYKWSNEYKALGGQVKIPRVMKEEDFKDFEGYIKSLQ